MYKLQYSIKLFYFIAWCGSDELETFRLEASIFSLQENTRATDIGKLTCTYCQMLSSKGFHISVLYETHVTDFETRYQEVSNSNSYSVFSIVYSRFIEYMTMFYIYISSTYFICIWLKDLNIFINKI